MLNLWVADRLPPLARRLAEDLQDPLDDPMQPDWVAVPTIGMQRWLRLELARNLGTGAGPRSASDGVAANIAMPFPGSLRRAVLEATESDNGAGDPWSINQLVWTVLKVLLANEGSAELAPISRLPEGATWYGRARRVADLFDRYATRRPDLIERWGAGDAVGPAGAPLDSGALWQFRLWTAVRKEIGFPSSAERLPELLTKVAEGSLKLDLPPRLSVFGVATVPGGASFGPIATAIAAHHDLSIYMLDPAVLTSARLRPLPVPSDLSKLDDPAAQQVRQQLLKTWGKPSREAQRLVAALDWPEPKNLEVSREPQLPDQTDQTLLGRLQHHLRSDMAASDQPAHVLDPADQSVQIHACPGETRQVEVLRDVILGLLRDDPTLSEQDILVVSPDLERFAPLLEGAFGPPHGSPGAARKPRSEPLRYHLTDRSLRLPDSLLSAASELLELAGGRFGGSSILDFASMAPVARMFDFDDNTLDLMEQWLDGTEMRWGLHEDHRKRLGLPGLKTNTWAATSLQLLMGMAIHDDEPTFGPHRSTPFGVEGSDVTVLSRVLEFATILERVEREWSRPAAVDVWADRILWSVTNLFSLARGDEWQVERLRRLLSQLITDSDALGAGRPPLLSLQEMKQVLSQAFQGSTARPRFFDGALTVTSLRPLRWVPHRVVCILGMDETAFGQSPMSGDDLAALSPQLGDADPRADQRQALLEVLLSAEDGVVITRSGHDIRKNVRVPPPVALAEFLSEVADITGLSAEQVSGRLESSRPRQSHDERNLQFDAPFTFDRAALEGARAKRESVATASPPPLEPVVAPASVDLDELRRLLRHPVRFFYRERLGVSFPQPKEQRLDTIPIQLGNLEAWDLGTQMLNLSNDGKNVERRLKVLEKRGSLPPGSFGKAAVDGPKELVGAFLEELDKVNRPSEGVLIDVTVAGSRIVGTVENTDPAAGVGPVWTTLSKRDNRLDWLLWLDLLVLSLSEPETVWQGIGLAKKTATKPVRVDMRLRGEDAPSRVRFAEAGLRGLLELRDRALCEPLPLFSKVTVKTTKGGETKVEGWDNMFGAATDVANRTAFGAYSTHDLLTLAPVDGDPEFEGCNAQSRLLRYHGFVDDLMESTVIR